MGQKGSTFKEEMCVSCSDLFLLISQALEGYLSSNFETHFCLHDASSKTSQQTAEHRCDKRSSVMLHESRCCWAVQHYKREKRVDSLAEILMIKSSQISSIDRAPEF